MSTTRFQATTMKPLMGRHSSSTAFPASSGHCCAATRSSSKKRRYADTCGSVTEDRNNRQRTLKNGSLRTLGHTERHIFKSGSDREKVRRSNGGAAEKRHFAVPVEDDQNRKKKVTESEDVKTRSLKNGSFKTLGHNERHFFKSGSDREKVRRSNGGATEKRHSAVPVEDQDRKKKATEDVKTRSLKNGSFKTLGHNERHFFKSGSDREKVRRSDGGATEKHHFAVPVEDQDRKKKVTKSEDVKTKEGAKNDDACRILIKPERKLIQVERLGGLKLRFKFLGTIQNEKEAGISNHHQKKSGDGDDGVKKLAVQEIPQQNLGGSSWWKSSREREREAARRKIESMIKTADISNNYYAIMGKLDGMFGDSEWVMEAFYGARNEKPLEKLGLFLKD